MKPRERASAFDPSNARPRRTDPSPPVSSTLWTRGFKRGFDLLFGGLLLLVCSPLMLIIAAWIKLSSPGPVFFLQDRVGWHGRIFRPFKFRTMRAGRQPDPQELVPLEHGDITRVGRILRRIKLDELPQLINVVRGEMSLVGPRPTLPDQAAAYDEFRRQRLLLRPGMTGLAQVHGSTAIAWNQRILFDVAYVRRCGFFLDMRILLRTLLVLLAGETRFARRFETTRYARFVSPPANYEESGQEPHLQAAHRG